jgi:hypothetical protein
MKDAIGYPTFGKSGKTVYEDLYMDWLFSIPFVEIRTAK